MADIQNIPVIDFETCGLHHDTVGKQAYRDVGKEISDAFSKFGCCYLKNHGIEKEMLENYLCVSKEFFEQSEEEKLKHVRRREINFGWSAMEREKFNSERPGDLKEAFNFQPANDPNDWLTIDFQHACKNMFDRCTKLTYRMCDVISVGLDLGDTFLRDLHAKIGTKNNSTTLRSQYFPPLPSEFKIKPRQIRLGEHSDFGSFTLLFQDDVGGFEVNIPGQGYVPATPVPDTVILQLGDLMQRWTSDRLIATKHRVLIPEDEICRRKSVQSVVFYAYPDDGVIIRCLDGSDKYEPIMSQDYLNYKFNITLQ